MTPIKAFFYDGKTSAKREVWVSLEAPDRLRVRGDDLDRSYPVSAMRISPRIGNTRRSLYLPDGSQCEIENNDALDRFLKQQRKGSFHRFLHHWESKLSYAFLALPLTVLAVWGLANYGIPALARQVAFNLPPSTESRLGQEALKTLDQLLFSPSQLPDARKRELNALFDRMKRAIRDGKACRLELRKSPKVGANAFALPSGIIILTDELAQLALRDEELVAVLAHEIGHVRFRHTLRHLLQNSATGLLIAALTGDIFSSASLAAALPTALLEAKYSRDFEREADLFAMEYLKSQGIAPKYFADLLLRLQGQRDSANDLPNFLSSHPATEERINRFLHSP